jgi:TPP-dependent trihydroxycyclohexane-1,2-dione (THcHDO) dehydratase
MFSVEGKFLIKKKKHKISSYKLFAIFGHQNPGAGSGSALNQCGSTTLHFKQNKEKQHCNATLRVLQLDVE